MEEIKVLIGGIWIGEIKINDKIRIVDLMEEISFLIGFIMFEYLNLLSNFDRVIKIDEYFDKIKKFV